MIRKQYAVGYMRWGQRILLKTNYVFRKADV
jgi:hypothetical protein